MWQVRLKRRAWPTHGVTPWGLAVALAVGAAGCARKESGVYRQEHAILAAADDFGLLLLSAGLRTEPLLADGELTVDEARRLRLMLDLEFADGGMQRYGPRVAASYLLAEVITGGQPVTRPVLNARVRRFEPLAVLRPDGYLVMTLTGTPLQCAGPVQVQAGTVTAAEFVLGTFYSARESGFREDTRLPRLPRSAYFNGVVVSLEPQEPEVSTPSPRPSGAQP
ncbi:hypothetical protein [Hyalangium versicolor]|uniref:hypothetical protein n=1 Tax=Hyalangium versicolor TaxID=2861190 RepID=UPI001CCE5A7E|nr:hypothetical protein [Hyalangium versicolor]